MKTGPQHEGSRPVFLCYASVDRVVVRELWLRLKMDGFDPRLDEDASQACDVILICLSRKALASKGYLQKQIKVTLEVVEKRSERSVSLILLRLDDCEVPRELRKWRWVDLFERRGYRKLKKSLEHFYAERNSIESYTLDSTDFKGSRSVLEDYFYPPGIVIAFTKKPSELMPGAPKESLQQLSDVEVSTNILVP